MHADLVERLRAAGCVFAEDEADVLTAAARDAHELERMTAARVEGEPLEYILGFADFAGVRVRVDPGVFIPRQRTEFLIQEAASLATQGAICLDLCCGSGALGLAFTRFVPDAEVHAADIDPVAVRCARRNLPHVYESDLFSALPHDLCGRFDVILANVPYVPSSELDTMPVEAREHEPAITHDGGPDGLDVLRRVLTEITMWLAPGGHVLTEIAEDQQQAAERVFADAGLDVRCAYSEWFDTTVAVGGVRR